MSEREHIKMGAGYTYATKGEGSTVRIHSPREAYVGALPPHIPILPVMYHPFFEQMAREIGAENAALKAENKRLQEQFKASLADRAKPYEQFKAEVAARAATVTKDVVHQCQWCGSTDETCHHWALTDGECPPCGAIAGDKA